MHIDGLYNLLPPLVMRGHLPFGLAKGIVALLSGLAVASPFGQVKGVVALPSNVAAMSLSGLVKKAVAAAVLHVLLTCAYGKICITTEAEE